MTDQTTAEVVFECDFGKLERKIKNPTVALMGRVLEEAGLDGVWTMRDAHRIRKKGRGRFGVIRMEERGATTCILIWCKPQGNETGFEYSLWPPKDTDINSAYRLLSRVHPVTLYMPESKYLASAFMNRMMRVEPVGRKIKPMGCLEVKADETQGKSLHVKDSGQVGSDSNSASESTCSLKIDPVWEVWSDEVADRAIMAISFVSEDGFISCEKATENIVCELDIQRFCGADSEFVFEIDEVAKSIVATLIKRKRYIKNAVGRNDESMRGYMITHKGEKRLECIAGVFGKTLSERMSPNWRPSTVGVSQAQTSDSVAVLTPWSLSQLKEMVAAHDKAEKQIGELDELVAVIDSEIDALRVEITSLEEEMKIVDEKKRHLQEMVSKKNCEKKGLKDAKRPHEEERDRLERLMGTKR